MLAGFDVAAISFLLGRERATRRGGLDPHAGIITLLTSLVGLVAAAFLYGVAAALRGDEARAAAMVLTVGMVAAVAMSGLFLGLVLLIVVALPRGTSVLVARGVILVLPLLETVYVAVSVLDVLRIGHDDSAAERLTRGILVGAIGAALALGIALQAKWDKLLPCRRLVKETRFAGFSLVMVFFGILLFLLCMYGGRESRRSGVAAIGVGVVWTVFVVIFAVAVRVMAQAEPGAGPKPRLTPSS
ncbi:hypothetical protein [Streptomyces roseoverticillatus]|uniref:Integral membrane protein n=1 Tax=Streptomyces roseoverticillatus TaxID=66429 RepID=A0ABV3IQZ1_9ACTN